MTSKKRVFTCIVPSCKQTSSKSELKFYKFPTDPERRTKWKSAIGLSEAAFINKHNFVCQRHFMPQNIGKHYLTKNAVPTLNVEVELNGTENCGMPSNISMEYEQNNVSQNTSCLISKKSQTDPIDEEIEFLKLINKVSCFHCSRDNDEINCEKCRKTRKLSFLYKQKLVAANKKMQLLKTTIKKLKRNFNILKKNHTKIKNINMDETIDKSPANEMTKNVCKLLLKEDYFYTENDKKFAQCLYYKSAATYKYLKNILELKLPSVSSIYKWSPIRFILPGTNEIFLNELKIYSKTCQ